MPLWPLATGRRRLEALPHLYHRAVEAVVLYSYGFGDYPFKEPGMGMNFVKVSPEDRALIKSFIQEQIEKDILKRP